MMRAFPMLFTTPLIVAVAFAIWMTASEASAQQGTPGVRTAEIQNLGYHFSPCSHTVYHSPWYGYCCQNHDYCRSCYPRYDQIHYRRPYNYRVLTDYSWHHDVYPPARWGCGQATDIDQLPEGGQPPEVLPQAEAIPSRKTRANPFRDESSGAGPSAMRRIFPKMSARYRSATSFQARTIASGYSIRKGK